MRSTIVASLALALLASLGLAGCAIGASAPIGEPPVQADTDLSGLWSLTDAVVGGESVDLESSAEVVFLEGTAHIYLGCQDVDQKMRAGLVVTTASFEQYPAASCVEIEDSLQQTLDSLDLVTDGVRTGDELTLTGDGVQLEFALVPAPDAAEVIGSWSLTSIMYGDHGTVCSDCNPVTIDFGADGAVSGTTSCGSFDGSYTLASGLTIIDDLDYTSGSCFSLDGSNGVEADVHDVIDHGFVIRVTDDGLSLDSLHTTSLYYTRAT